MFCTQVVVLEANSTVFSITLRSVKIMQLNAMIIARRAYCAVSQNFDVRLSVCVCVSVCLCVRTIPKQLLHFCVILSSFWDLETPNFARETFKIRSRKGTRKWTILRFWGPDFESFTSDIWRIRVPNVRHKLTWAADDGPSGHLPCGCNLVI